MAEKLLSDRDIREGLRRAADSVKTDWLKDGAGLWLELQPSGKGWWRQRFTFGGRPNRISLGTYPQVSLSKARGLARTVRAQIADGINPVEARKAKDTAEAQASELAALRRAGKPLPDTFEHVAREWLDLVHVSKVSPGHIETIRRRLERDAFPFIGPRPLAEITAPELLTCARRIEYRHASEYAGPGAGAGQRSPRTRPAPTHCTHDLDGAPCDGHLRRVFAIDLRGARGLCPHCGGGVRVIAGADFRT